MKKLYFLDEEETQRILNIHESATKNQYLGEQSVIGAPNNGTIEYKSSLPTKNVGLERDKNWETLYSCVKKQPGVKSGKMKDGSTAYNVGGVWYYNSGRKMVNGKMASYTCDTEFKGGKSTGDKSKSGGIQQKRQQIMSSTQTITKAIQKLLGLPETGVMDTTLLQKINEKLNGGGQQSRPKLEALPQLNTAGLQQQASQLKSSMTPEQLATALQQRVTGVKK
jgi:hypothetical protein